MRIFSSAAIVLLVPLLATVRPGAAQVLESKGFRLDLYSSFEFELQLEEEGNGDPNGSFDADQIDLLFNYERESLRIAVDLVVEHGVSTEDERGNIALSFGFVEYAFSDAVRVRAGKYFTPFGIHNELLTVRSSFLSVKEPWSTNKPSKLTENGFRFFPRRQVGLGILGSAAAGTGLLEYDLFVANGEQEETNPFEEDNNSEKAFTGRLDFLTGSHDQVRLGVSTYYDTLNVDEDRQATQSSVGLQATYDPGRWRIWAEAVSSTVDPDDAESIDQIGAFVDLGYRIGRFMPYVQYQITEVDIDERSERGEAVVAGVMIRLKYTAVVKIENGLFMGNDDNPKFDGIPGRDYNEVKIGFVVGF